LQKNLNLEEEKPKYSNASKKPVVALASAENEKKSVDKRMWGFNTGHNSRTLIASAGEKEVC